MFQHQRLLLMMGAVLLLGNIARAQSLSAQDREFMLEAAKGGMTEVHVAQMASRMG
jgi:hypothetical protein